MTSNQPSLRALATLLGHTHPALSRAVREGRLTKGVRIDERGMVAVFDAKAAAKQWRDIHVVRVDELLRRETRRRPPPAAPAEASTVAIVDRHDFDWTAVELLGSYEAHNLVAWVLIELALASAKEATFVKRVAALLHEKAQLRGYDEETAVHAERIVALTAKWILHPEPELEDDEP